MESKLELANLYNVAHHLISSSESQTRRIAADLAQRLTLGDVILLTGPLGAGKTTFVRGFLEGLGYQGPVKSPTFNLIQTFPTTPAVMHADLYRLESSDGIGLEEYLDTSVCLIEWPDRLRIPISPERLWEISIDFAEEGRAITLDGPA